MAWSPVDDTLAVISEDRDVHLFDYASGRWLAVLKGHTKQTRSVAISSDGKTLASAAENEVTLWHLPTRQAMFALKPQTPGIVNALRFSPDNQALAAIVLPYVRSPHARPGGACLWLTQQPATTTTPQERSAADPSR